MPVQHHDHAVIAPQVNETPNLEPGWDSRRDSGHRQTMKLYGFGPTRSIRALWTLRELGIDFEFVNVNLMKGEHRQPAFLAINPAGKLPVLIDGELVLTESVAIALYLAEKYADKGLVPEQLKPRAEVYRWLLFTATELEQPLWRIARHTALYPPNERCRPMKSISRGETSDISAVLEEHMKGREHVAGNALTIADLVLAYTPDWANEVRLLDARPALQVYMERMYNPRPAEIAAALSAERPRWHQ